MEECDFCGEEFEDEVELHIHWGEEHEDELNSHQEEKVKKAEREKEKRERKERERKKNLAFKILASGLALGLAAVIIPQMLSAVSNDGGTVNTGQAVNFSLEDEPMLGQESANVSIVAFEDFYCPACKSFDATVKPRLKENYIDTGQAKFYFMNFPLSNHEPQASSAAIAAECVYRQNESEFWNYHDALFQQQRQMDYSVSGLMDLARDSTTGLDYDQLRSCISSEETSSEVEQDFQKGVQAGVGGTPTIYVNGRQAPDFSYSTIRTMIEQELPN